MIHVGLSSKGYGARINTCQPCKPKGKGELNMEVKIDLKELLSQEFEGEGTLAVLIKDEIVKQVSSSIKEYIETEVQAELKAEIESFSKDVLEKAKVQVVQDLVAIIDTEYTPVDKYGSKGKPTTIRNEIHKTVIEQCVYNRGGYSSDKSEFTRAVDSIVEKEVKAFGKAYETLVNETFTKEALDYATQKLKERLGIKL